MSMRSSTSGGTGLKLAVPHGESDIDIAVVLQGEVFDRSSTVMEMTELSIPIELEEDVTLRPIPISQSEWNSPSLMGNPDLIAAMKEGVSLLGTLSA